MATFIGEWPPAYDAEELARIIDGLADRGLESDGFYNRYHDDPSVFQGDVVAFQAGVPVFNESFEPEVVDDFDWWLVIGNTCDMERDRRDVPWSQIVPIETVGPMEQLGHVELNALRRYSQSRRFYLPPWDEEQVCRIADFLRPVGIDKDALRSAKRVARLSYSGWVLLHACLVRFLARGDGRHNV
jgi:hypothetical protein